MLMHREEPVVKHLSRKQKAQYRETLEQALRHYEEQLKEWSYEQDEVTLYALKNKNAQNILKNARTTSPKKSKVLTPLPIPYSESESMEDFVLPQDTRPLLDPSRSPRLRRMFVVVVVVGGTARQLQPPQPLSLRRSPQPGGPGLLRQPSALQPRRILVVGGRARQQIVVLSDNRSWKQQESE
ncbi:hypothetical protein GWK47_026990 [Chionoecetes opilio]|uniref:Uncharacterized protein n=1 Tax=Chionoecetes opilio TaxID=41210 RepID=A0A8J8WCN9_CHIOP|nr:hypothetical protein GWK47_026990 [Chionoecetes opilio]